VFIKIGAMFVYHTVLQALGLLTFQFKMWSFICVTPIIKLFFFRERRIGVLLFSIFFDTLNALTYYLFVVHLRGAYHGLTVLIFVMQVLLWEGMQYLLFRKPDDSYVIKLSKNPLDYCLALVISGSFVLHGSVTSFDTPLTPFNLAGMWVPILVFDFLFALGHYLEHHTKTGWESHKQHHEYTSKDLNSIANFWASFSDSMIMNGPVVVAVFISWLMGPHAHWLAEAELIYAAALSHSKYIHNQFHLMLNWELDACDLVMNQVRMSGFHNAHHDHPGYGMSVFGYVPDAVCGMIWKYLGVVA
jgi:hypothetical protein